MFYKLSFDMKKIDKSIQDGTNTIYAETTNIDEIEYANVKKGFFDNIILSPCSVENWPNVEFYYSSIVSDSESDYLLNIKRWPLIHIRVMEEFDKNGITGLQYFPIKLIDTAGIRDADNEVEIIGILEYFSLKDITLIYSLNDNTLYERVGFHQSRLEWDIIKIYSEVLYPLHVIKTNSFTPGIYTFINSGNRVRNDDYFDHILDELKVLNPEKCVPAIG